MVPPSILARAAVVIILAALLAACGENWRTSTYDPRRACESFGGGFRESDGTCRHGGP